MSSFSDAFAFLALTFFDLILQNLKSSWKQFSLLISSTSRLFHADTFAFTEEGFMIKSVGLSYRYHSIP